MTQMADKKQQVLEKISQLDNKRILIVGDVGLDQYVNGSVKRISPEAPVPVLDVVNEEIRLGLACNVAQNITSLGGAASLISVIGKDQTGAQLKELLAEASVDTSHLVEDSSRSTTRKLRVMSGHHHIVRVDYEKKLALDEAMEKQVIQRFTEELGRCELVVLQDYAKGVLSKSLCQQIIEQTKKQGKMLLVDPHRNTPLEYYRGASLMTPNLDEALALTKADIDSAEVPSLEALGQALMGEVQSEKMVITLSQNGMSLFEKSQCQVVPTFARKVSDVTGAGDTVIAAISLALAAGFQLEEACVLANYAAGVVVGKIGCVPCYRNELIDYIHSH